jgi:hypothetical protein
VGFGAQPDQDFFGLRQGIVWRSADGVAWQQTVEPQFLNVTPLVVASVESIDFVVGVLATCSEFAEEPCSEPPDAGNAMWRSADGGPWERMSLPAGMQGASSLDELVATPDMLAVTGAAGNESFTATVWVSNDDGLSWSESTDLAGLDPIDALAAGPPGLVAFGTVFAEEDEFVSVRAASSADGRSFSPINVPPLTNVAIESAVAGATGMSAVGYGENEDFELSAAALYSADGTTWIPATTSDESFADSGMLDVHALPSGYVALGFTPSAEDFAVEAGTSWISRDGQTWRLLAPVGDGSARLTSSAVGGTGLVVFAATEEETEEDVTSTVSAYFAPLAELDP